MIGPATHAALAGRASVTPLGPLQIKGKREPVEAYALAATDEAPLAPMEGSGPSPS